MAGKMINGPKPAQERASYVNPPTSPKKINGNQMMPMHHLMHMAKTGKSEVRNGMKMGPVGQSNLGANGKLVRGMK